VETPIVSPPHHFLKNVVRWLFVHFSTFFNVQPSSYEMYFLNKKQKQFGLGSSSHKTPWLSLPCRVILHQLGTKFDSQSSCFDFDFL
jgi:hypothetical protein